MAARRFRSQLIVTLSCLMLQAPMSWAVFNDCEKIQDYSSVWLEKKLDYDLLLAEPRSRLKDEIMRACVQTKNKLDHLREVQKNSSQLLFQTCQGQIDFDHERADFSRCLMNESLARVEKAFTDFLKNQFYSKSEMKALINGLESHCHDRQSFTEGIDSFARVGLCLEFSLENFFSKIEKLNFSMEKNNFYSDQEKKLIDELKKNKRSLKSIHEDYTKIKKLGSWAVIESMPLTRKIGELRASLVQLSFTHRACLMHFNLRRAVNPHLQKNPDGAVSGDRCLTARFNALKKNLFDFNDDTQDRRAQTIRNKLENFEAPILNNDYVPEKNTTSKKVNSLYRLRADNLDSQVIQEKELIDSAQNLLKNAKDERIEKQDQSKNLWSNLFFNTESDLSRQAYEKSWKPKLEEYKKIAQQTQGDQDQKISAVVSALRKDYLTNYFRDQRKIEGHFDGTQKGANCLVSAKMIVMTLNDLGLKPEGGKKLGVEVFEDHVQAVVYDAKKNKTHNLLLDESYSGSKGNIYKPEFLIHEVLDQKKITSAVAYRDLELKMLPVLNKKIKFNLFNHFGASDYPVASSRYLAEGQSVAMIAKIKTKKEQIESASVPQAHLKQVSHNESASSIAIAKMMRAKESKSKNSPPFYYSEDLSEIRFLRKKDYEAYRSMPDSNSKAAYLEQIWNQSVQKYEASSDALVTKNFLKDPSLASSFTDQEFSEIQQQISDYFVQDKRLRQTDFEPFLQRVKKDPKHYASVITSLKSVYGQDRMLDYLELEVQGLGERGQFQDSAFSKVAALLYDRREFTHRFDAENVESQSLSQPSESKSGLSAASRKIIAESNRVAEQRKLEYEKFLEMILRCFPYIGWVEWADRCANRWTAQETFNALSFGWTPERIRKNWSTYLLEFSKLRCKTEACYSYPTNDAGGISPAFPLDVLLVIYLVHYPEYQSLLPILEKAQNEQVQYFLNKKFKSSH